MPRRYPAETTEAFCDGHVRAFAFFGGVPQSILYDNTKIAVARILGDGKRQRTRVFTELQSHYLFEDRFGRPGKGVEIVKRSDRVKGFVVLPKRWVVERTFAWLGRCRRLAKDWENLNRKAHAFLRLASIRLMLRKLCIPV